MNVPVPSGDGMLKGLEALSAACHKRTKNSEKAVGEMLASLDEVRGGFTHAISFPASGLPFDRLWPVLKQAVQDLLGGVKDARVHAEILNCLQMFIVLVPVGEKLQCFAEVFGLLEANDVFNTERLKTAPPQLLSIVVCLVTSLYPVLFTKALLSVDASMGVDAFRAQCRIEQVSNALISMTKGSFGTMPLQVRLAVLRLLQGAIVCKSVYRYEEECDDDMLVNAGDGWLSLTYYQLGVSRGSELSSLVAGLIEEGNRLCSEFLKMIRDRQFSGVPCLTAWINLLPPMIYTRPTFLSPIVTCLLSLTDAGTLPSSVQSLSLVELRSFQHCLRASLSILMSVPRAEKYASLVQDAIDRCLVPDAGKSSAGAAVGPATALKKTQPSGQGSGAGELAAEDEKEIEASLTAADADSTARPSAAFASSSAEGAMGLGGVTAEGFVSNFLAQDRRLGAELLKIPMPLVVEMVVRMLGAWSIEQMNTTVMARWPRRATVPAEDAMAATTTASSRVFELKPTPLTPELPGEVIHLAFARVLQTLTELIAYHRVVDVSETGNGRDEDALALSKASQHSGLPEPLVPTCRLIALIAAHVGEVKSAVLISPEQRRRRQERLQRRNDPRNRQQAANRDSDSDEDDADDDEKNINQILLSWVNEELPQRFELVKFWLEAVWVREGKEGIGLGNEPADNEDADAGREGECYGRLFDLVVGLTGECFMRVGPNASASASASDLQRVLAVFGGLPRLRSSLLSNLLLPLVTEPPSRELRTATLACTADLLLRRPALRPMLLDLLLSLLQGADDAELRADALAMVLGSGLYPGLRSLTEQLEAYAFDMLDELLDTDTTTEEAVKRMKLSSSTEALASADTETFKDSDSKSLAAMDSDSKFLEAKDAVPSSPALSASSAEFEASSGLLLGLLRRNPGRLLAPLMERFARFPSAWKQFVLERGMPGVVHAWGSAELQALLRHGALDGSAEDASAELRLRIVALVYAQHAGATEAETVDFFSTLTELIEARLAQGTWDGRFVVAALPGLLQTRSDGDVFLAPTSESPLSRLITALHGHESVPDWAAVNRITWKEAFEKICAAGGGADASMNANIKMSASASASNIANASTSTSIITPTQLFVALHLQSPGGGSAGLKAQIEAIQVCYAEGGLFGAGVVVAGLGQLVDVSPLPVLLGRSLLLTLPLVGKSAASSATPSSGASPLNTAFVLGLLGRLVNRRVWEGWIRCCRALVPASLSLLLQLPTGQLEAVLATAGAGADLRAPLRDFLYKQPPSVRARFASILRSLEK